MKRYFLIFGVLLACNGTTGIDSDQPTLDENETVQNNDRNDNDPTNDDPTNEDPAFELDKISIKLLPFHVRLKKLETVVGLPSTDPIFSELLNARYSLGDHNYGSNIGADLTWNATKISLWMKSVQPICASEAMAQRYPDLYGQPDDLDALWMSAYSRPIEADERADIEAIDISNLNEAQRYEAYCLTVLSSAEFVGQ